MTSIDIDFVLVERVPSIRSGRWHTDGRLLFVFGNFVSVDSLPDIVFNFEEPTVIKAIRFVRIASEDEDPLLIRIGHRDMLTPWSWEVFSSAFKLCPMHLL